MMSTRTASRVFIGVFAATLVLTGCGPAAEQDGPIPPATQTQRWEAVAGDEGSALVLLGEGDRQIFHLACLNGPSRMQAIADDFMVIGSEERMTLGAADEAFGLVADVERQGPGVQAEGAIDPSFLDHFARSEDISAVYGAQTVGPWPAPSQALRDGFVQACRTIAATASDA